MANALMGGGKLTLGNDTVGKVEVKFDATKDGTQTAAGVVGVKDLLDGDGNLKVDDASLAEMVARISVAANGSGVFTVGAGSSDKMISLTEKRDFYDSTKTSDYLIDTKEKFLGMVSVTGGDKTNAAGGLTLQIGDTSASYNQLVVSIGDMHTSSMKSATAGNTIADIDISTRQGCFQEQILPLMIGAFYEPNVKELQKRYERNCKLLKKYPYLFRKDFPSFDELPVRFFPYDDNGYVPFYPDQRRFGDYVNFKNPVVSRNFFKDLEKPVLADDVYSQYELEYLNDNVRKSEHIGRENHVYLHYAGWGTFCAHLQCLDFHALLEDRKLVLRFMTKLKLDPALLEQPLYH